jgi:hypothetical protein
MQSTGARAGIAVAAVAAVVILFFVLRDDDEGDDAGTTAATTTAPAEAKPGGGAGGTGEPEKEPKPKPEGVATEIRVEGGQPVGGVERIEATVDETVRIVVSSPDTTEEVHVHGYDLFAEFSPRRPAKLEFDASIEGVFEIELEHAHAQIAELTVEP